MQFDLPIDQLRTYRPEIGVPEDFDEFWAGTLAEARRHDLGVGATLVETGFAAIDTYDVRFAGFGGHPIRAWLRVPDGGREGHVPVVVEYHGYGGGRGWAIDPVMWPLAGYAHLSVDTRGQGVGRQRSATPDPEPGNTGEPTGWMTRGIRAPETAYYRRVFTDAVRAVDAARTLPGVDPARVVVTGVSQGGGIALAVAGLVPDLAAAMVDVPFLCHIERAITLTDRDPYQEVVRFLRAHREDEQAVLRTLSYVDAANHAVRAKAPALFSVGLMDLTCPPRTVFAAYNRYRGDDTGIVVYPYNDHEGGEAQHERAKLDWLRARVAP
jgi:cephalosporin-C deacetylase